MHVLVWLLLKRAGVFITDNSKWFQVRCLCGEYFLDIDAKCGSIEDA
jgi:hypothetical protein